MFIHNVQGWNRNDVVAPRKLEVRISLHRKSDVHLLHEFPRGEIAILRNARDAGSRLGQRVEIRGNQAAGGAIGL